MDTLNGKTALVTGSSRGIGKAIAIRLAEAGADIVINFRVNEEEARVTLERVTSTGRRGIMVQADVSKNEDVSRLVETVEEELGAVDILINNAAMARRQTMEQITETDWDEVLEVNLKSVFLVTQAVLPGMRKKRWGRIINISSGAAQTGGLVGLHYSASKGGMESLTRAYASRLVKEGITVNAVAPALIETDMTRDVENRKKLIPMGRLGHVDEVAEAVVFLAGNAYTTGQTLHLNGGLYFR